MQSYPYMDSAHKSKGSRLEMVFPPLDALKARDQTGHSCVALYRHYAYKQDFVCV
ncbi:hypothetical protein LINPERHAP2_LOCUS13987 [Linum perenne]